MATNPGSAFPTKTDNTDPNYQYGKAQNVSSPGAGDGTPWVALFLNDIFGFQQKLLTTAGIVPSGTPDNIVTSQYYDALLAIIAANPPAQATETVLGTAEIASIVESYTGTDDLRIVTPLKLNEFFKNVNRSLGTSGYQRFGPSGSTVIQWGTASVNADSNLLVSLPIAFENAIYVATAVYQEAMPTVGSEALGVALTSLSQITLYNSSNATRDMRYIAIGY